MPRKPFTYVDYDIPTSLPPVEPYKEWRDVPPPLRATIRLLVDQGQPLEDISKGFSLPVDWIEQIDMTRSWDGRSGDFTLGPKKLFNLRVARTQSANRRPPKHA
jgi:hypothetical protein